MNAHVHSSFPIRNRSSGVATGGWEQMTPTFCQDRPRYFHKINGKIIGGKVVANLQRSRGSGQKTFH